MTNMSEVSSRRQTALGLLDDMIRRKESEVEGLRALRTAFREAHEATQVGDGLSDAPPRLFQAGTEAEEALWRLLISVR